MKDIEKLIESNHELFIQKLDNIKENQERANKINEENHAIMYEKLKNHNDRIDKNKEKSIYLQGFYDRLDERQKALGKQFKGNKVFWIAFMGLSSLSSALIVYILTT